jgi:hypothetical protein
VALDHLNPSVVVGSLYSTGLSSPGRGAMGSVEEFFLARPPLDGLFRPPRPLP